MEVVHPEDAARRTSQRNLAIGIGISLALHLVISAVLLGTPPSSPSKGSVSFIDLKNVQLPAELPAPAPATPTAPPVEKAEPVPVAKTPTPEAAPEAAPDAAAAQPRDTQAEQAAAARPTVQEQAAATSFGLGMTKGYFRSIGNGETLRDGVRGYYLDMLERINQQWWLDQGVDKKGIGPIMVNVVIRHDGEIVDVQLMTGSGNPAYDKAVVKALASAGPLPPLPPDYREPFFLAPIRLVPPLNLMGW